MKIPPKKSSPHYFSSQHAPVGQLKKIFVSVRRQSLVMETSGEVFSPEKLDKGTEILLDSLIIPEFKDKCNILDLGAGYGPITIWLAKYLTESYPHRNQTENHGDNYRIYASEVNQRAVWLLKRNILANNLQNVEILSGKFQEQVKHLKEKNIRFQAVYTNPPLKTGHKTMLELFSAAAELLTENGFIQYVHKKKLGAEGFQNKLRELFPTWSLQTVRKQAGYHIIVFSPNPLSLPPRIVPSSGYF